MALHLHTSPIYGTLFGDPELETVLDDRRALREMVRFEAALARVEGRLGLIPDGEGLSRALDADRTCTGGPIGTRARLRRGFRFRPWLRRSGNRFRRMWRAGFIGVRQARM